MYTLAISVLIGVIASFVAIFIANRISHEGPKISMVKGICIITPFFIVAGLICAGKVLRESIPLREKVISVSEIGATHNADGSQSFVIETRAWYQHSYGFFLRSAEGVLVPWHLAADQPVLIVEDPSLDKVGSLTVWERERDPSSPLMKWAIFTETDRRITKHIFRVPPKTVVHHVDR